MRKAPGTFDEITLVIILILLYVIWPKHANSAELGYKYGLGVFNSTGARAASLYYQDNLKLPIFVEQVEIGGLIDNQAGRHSTAFGNYSLGIEATPGKFFIQTLVGIGGISTPDYMLGGRFQFNEDLIVGVRDSSGVSVAIDYKHISSGGIYTPNVGRDCILLRVGVPLPW